MQTTPGGPIESPRRPERPLSPKLVALGKWNPDARLATWKAERIEPAVAKFLELYGSVEGWVAQTGMTPDMHGEERSLALFAASERDQQAGNEINPYPLIGKPKEDFHKDAASDLRWGILFMGVRLYRVLGYSYDDIPKDLLRMCGRRNLEADDEKEKQSIDWKTAWFSFMLAGENPADQFAYSFLKHLLEGKPANIKVAIKIITLLRGLSPPHIELVQKAYPIITQARVAQKELLAPHPVLTDTNWHDRAAIIFSEPYENMGHPELREWATEHLHLEPDHIGPRIDPDPREGEDEEDEEEDEKE